MVTYFFTWWIGDIYRQSPVKNVFLSVNTIRLITHILLVIIVLDLLCVNFIPQLKSPVSSSLNCNNFGFWKTGVLKRGLIFFFSKIIFPKFLLLLYSYYVRYSTGSGTLFDWVRYTIRLDPVHYLTGSGTLFDWVWYTIRLGLVHYSLGGATNFTRCPSLCGNYAQNNILGGKYKIATIQTTFQQVSVITKNSILANQYLSNCFIFLNLYNFP